MDGTGELFSPVIPALEAAYQVSVARYPKDLPLGYPELEQYARSACPQSQPYFLLGESFSGPLAIQIAASNPAGLRGLILCASFAANPRPMLSPLSVFAPLLPLRSAPSALLSAALLGSFATSHLCNSLVSAVRSVSMQVLQSRLRSIAAINVVPELATVQVPVLYLRPTHDRLVPQSALDQICRANSAVQVATIAGPHCLLQANPTAAAASINTFISGVRNAL